jgi:hypothetical protein
MTDPQSRHLSRKSLTLEEQKPLPTFNSLQTTDMYHLPEQTMYPPTAYHYGYGGGEFGHWDQIYHPHPAFHFQPAGEYYGYYHPTAHVVHQAEKESQFQAPHQHFPSSPSNSSTTESSSHYHKAEEQFAQPMSFATPQYQPLNINYSSEPAIWAIPVEMISSSEVESRPIPAIVLSFQPYF